MKINKNIILTIVSIIIVILIIFGIYKLISFGIQNSAISMEESIESSKSDIDIILQRRVDELTQLINTVKDSKEFEQKALEGIIQARSEAASGDIEQSNLTLKSVAEQYPQLQTMELYKNVMTAISINENQLKQYRETYNSIVKDYRKFVRQWPNKGILKNLGYEVKNYSLFEANVPAVEYNPTQNNLWED